MCTFFCCNIITHLISNIYKSKRRWILGRSYPDSNETCCKRRRHCTYSHWEMQRRYIWICVNLYAHMRHFVFISSRFVDACSKLVLTCQSGLASDTPHMRHPTYATPYICKQYRDKLDACVGGVEWWSKYLVRQLFWHLCFFSIRSQTSICTNSTPQTHFEDCIFL